LRHRLPLRTWVAIVAAGAGIAWMYLAELTGGEARHLWGVLVALGVPLAAAANWTLLQHQASRAAPAAGTSAAATSAAGTSAPAAPQTDMLIAVLLGASLSAAVTFPFALPWQASGTDLAWLAFLGAFQLAVPCLLAVWAARSLKAPEAALLSLLEVLFGVSWAWLAGGESPSQAVLGGGLLVLGALALNEAWALRERAK
jgi:drug/metabolite transporter (DMT)-like permease